MVTKQRSTGAVVAALMLLLGACSVSGTGNSPSEASTKPPAVSASPLPQAALDKGHRYADGVTLRVSDITESKLEIFPTTEDPEAKEGDPYIILTLTWENRSESEIEIAPIVTVRVGADGRTAAKVYAGEDRDQLNIAPGQTDEYEVACLIPEADRSKVVLEISDVDPSRNVVLAGSI